MFSSVFRVVCFLFKWLFLTAMVIVVTPFALVLAVLLFLVVCAVNCGYRLYRTWTRRNLTTAQRQALRTLERCMKKCADIGGQLDPGSPLDGVLQIQSLHFRNSLVAEELDTAWKAAREALVACHGAGIPLAFLEEAWGPSAEEVALHQQVVGVTEAMWRRENPLSGLA